MPGNTLEGKQQDQVSIINVVIVFCDMEGGCPIWQPVGLGQQPVPNCDNSYTPVKPQQICM
jgi:hypothetical protein